MKVKSWELGVEELGDWLFVRIVQRARHRSVALYLHPHHRAAISQLGRHEIVLDRVLRLRPDRHAAIDAGEPDEVLVLKIAAV